MKNEVNRTAVYTVQAPGCRTAEVSGKHGAATERVATRPPVPGAVVATGALHSYTASAVAFGKKPRDCLSEQARRYPGR